MNPFTKAAPAYAAPSLGPQARVRRLACTLVALCGLLWIAAAHAQARDIRIGVYENAPKIFLDQNGHVAGILGDLLAEIARLEDWTLTPVPCDWQGCLSALREGRIDLLPDLAYDEQRVTEFDFHTIPALHSWSAVYRREGAAINTMLDLKDKRVVVLDGSIQEGFLRNLLSGFGVSAQLIPVPSLEAGFRKVAENEADAVIANRFFGDLHAPRYELVTSPIMFQPARLFFATRRGDNAELLQAIDHRLEPWLVQQDSPYFQAIEKWTGKTQSGAMPSWAVKSLGALAAALLVALLVSAWLRRQVKEQTRELKRGADALAKSEAELRTILDNVEAYIYLKDTDGNYLFANKAAQQLWQSGEDVVGLNDETLFDAEGAANIRQNDRHVLDEGMLLQAEESATVIRSGQAGIYQSTKLPLRREDGSIYALCGISIDITERKRIEADLCIAATAFESQESLMITDANDVILRVNQAYTKETGYSSMDVVGQSAELLLAGCNPDELSRSMWNAVRRTGAWHGEQWGRRKDDVRYPKWLTITAVKRDDGLVTHYVRSHTDITERRAAEEKIRHLAFFDTVTELPNRRLLLDRLKQALILSAYNGREGALLFVDIDNFKDLNDTLGHDTGDMLLQQVGQRLAACIREGDTVARLGGDEFVVLLINLNHSPAEAAAQAKAIASQFLAALSAPYQLSTHAHRSTASIGITLFQGAQQTASELMKQADIAMYQAKKDGRNKMCFFDRQMQETISSRVLLADELRQALAMQQFQLYYQIQVGSDDQPIGAEALIRWRHPRRGLVSPAEFIPLAEETGLILQLGLWVLETACAQIRVWQDDAINCGLVLSINVSANQFHRADFVAQVLDAVQRHGINPRRLRLELTESILLEDVGHAIATMQAISDIGVRFSLDDFGTGYSSLQYLKRLPLDEIKIDQSFVCDIAGEISDKVIVRTIVAMAQSLGIAVIAEGVETEEQRLHLAQNGCSNYQGYLFGKPLPIDGFEALLRQRRLETAPG